MKQKVISSYGPTLSEAKQYLRVEHTDDDVLISSLISASYHHACTETNRDFAETVNTIDIISGSTEYICMQEISDVSTGSLYLRPDGSYVVFDDYYSGKLSYVTAASSSVPDPVRIAQLMLVSNWYDQRGNVVVGASVSKLDYAVEALLSPYTFINPV